MKLALLVLSGALLATLAGCQSDMTGASCPPQTLTACPNDPHPNLPVGDAYFEEMIGRYRLSDAK